MGCVQQAVLEFDEEVQAPWRPRLVAVPATWRSAARPACRGPPPVGPELARGWASAAAGGAARSAPARPSRTRPARAERRRRPGARRAAGASAGRRRRPAARRGSGSPAGLAGSPSSWRWPSGWRSAPGSAPLLVGGGRGPAAGRGESVVVQPGDTLWSIATSVAGDDDVRAVVDEIQELNGLHGAVLVPGQVLQLP